MKKTIIIFLLIISAAVMTGCSKQKDNQPLTDGEPQSGQATIMIKNSAFEPQTLVITDGTIITWENQDGASHQIVSDDDPSQYHIKSLESGILNPYKTWSFTFDGRGFYGEPWDIDYQGRGIFKYHCALHPEMAGTIIVQPETEN